MESVGEICVAGESLSNGYHAPEETAKRFKDSDGQKYYLTGDLGY